MQILLFQQRIIPAILVSLTAIATPLLFSPATVYFANLQDFSVPLGQMLPALLLVAGLAWLPLLALLLWLPANIRDRGLALALGTGIVFWFQANLLLWDYGVLDGRPIDWWAQWSRGVVDVLLWLTVLVACYLLAARLRPHLVTIAVLLLVIQAAAITATWWTTPPSPSFHRYTLDDTHKFDFSPQRNVVLLVLDAFQADIMQEIIDNRPQYREHFDGFTFYRNAAAGYAKTYPSFALLLAGQWYENRQPIQEFLRRSFRRRAITTDLLARDWRVDLFPYIPRVVHFSQRVATNMVPDRNRREQAEQAGTLIDSGLFRSSPHFLKPFWLNDYRWRLRQLLAAAAQPRENDPQQPAATAHPHQAVAFAQGVGNRATPNSRQPTFKLYHLMIPHEPFALTENLEMQRLPAGREGFKQHSVAALEVTRRLLDSLEQLGIYDDTMLLVISDHGGGEYHPGVRHDLLPASIEPAADGKIPDSHLASGLPLVMIKPFGARGALQISDAPVSLADIPATLAAALELDHDYREAGENILTLAEDQERLRRYIHYQFSGWSRDYLPAMTEYELRGHSWLPQNWRATGRTMVAGEDGSPQRRVAARQKVPGYHLGRRVEFSGATPYEPWLVSGWSTPEEHGTWSDGTRAKLLVPLAAPAASALKAKFNFRPFVAPPVLPAQKIRLYANGKPIATWEAATEGQFQATVPREEIAGGETLEFLFELPRGAAPLDHGTGADGRMLGISLQAMTIEEATTMTITPGQSINFGATGGPDAEKVITYGWGGQEPGHRWTTDKRAHLSFMLAEKADTDLHLRLWATPYLARGEITSQEVDVLINGKPVESWSIKEAGWFEARIPAELLGERTYLAVEFILHQAASPQQFGHSPDRRRLGLAVAELIIEKITP